MLAMGVGSTLCGPRHIQMRNHVNSRECGHAPYDQREGPTHEVLAEGTAETKRQCSANHPPPLGTRASPDDEREGHAHNVLAVPQGRDGGHDEGGTCGLRKGAKQVRTHASNVAHVVTDVVCRGCSRGLQPGRRAGISGEREGGKSAARSSSKNAARPRKHLGLHPDSSSSPAGLQGSSSGMSSSTLHIRPAPD